MTDATQMIWHKAYERELQNITSLRNHCDFKYEKDSANADTVRILNAVKPTVLNYTPGTGMQRQAISAGKKDLKIDQFKYFNIGMDDVVKSQTVPGAMEATAKEGAIALSEEGDKYVAQLIKDDFEETQPTIASITAFTPSKANAIEKIEDGFAVLYGNNCKVSDEYWLEVSPSFHKYIRPALTDLYTSNVDYAKKGIVGKYGNAMVTIENLLPTSKSGSNDVKLNVLRTGHAIAFVEQISKVEAYRPEDTFEDALKGLYTFGALIVRPEEAVVLPELI